jgi:hypothetical protein
MRLMLTMRRLVAGCALGLALLLVGGVITAPSAPECHGCAVLAPGLHCPNGGGEAVVGGTVC